MNQPSELHEDFLKSCNGIIRQKQILKTNQLLLRKNTKINENIFCFHKFLQQTSIQHHRLTQVKEFDRFTQTDDEKMTTLISIVNTNQQSASTERLHQLLSKEKTPINLLHEVLITKQYSSISNNPTHNNTSLDAAPQNDMLTTTDTNYSIISVHTQSTIKCWLAIMVTPVIHLNQEITIKPMILYLDSFSV